MVFSLSSVRSVHILSSLNPVPTKISIRRFFNFSQFFTSKTESKSKKFVYSIGGSLSISSGVFYLWLSRQEPPPLNFTIKDSTVSVVNGDNNKVIINK